MNEVSRLSEVLARCRDELQAIDGVVGTGIGTTGAGDVAIQVFVHSPRDVAGVKRRASALLGDIPLEVVVTGQVTAGDVGGGGEDG
jgi:hypothetical protein